jgi:hypothetical protein
MPDPVVLDLLWAGIHLVTCAPRLGDDVGHLLDLPLRTTECTELLGVSVYSDGGRRRWTYSLLRETTGTLVLGVTEEFDDTLLVRCESVESQQIFRSSIHSATVEASEV